MRIIETRTGRVVGTVDDAAAHSQVHTGAVHLHQGQTWVITELDLDDHAAFAVRGDPGWTTQAQSVSDFQIVHEIEHEDWGPLRCSFGHVTVRHQVTSFLRRLPGGEVLGEHPLDLPPRTLATKAVWWTMPVEDLAAAGVAEDGIPGAAHAAEHAAIGMLPLFATADRWDIGGVSTALHPDTGLPTILIYDGHPGGAGFAERGYRRIRPWLSGDPRSDRLVRVRVRLPLVHPVAEVRQRQRAARQGRGRRAARPDPAVRRARALTRRPSRSCAAPVRTRV